MSFDIFKTLSLSFLGEEWKDCYLKFRYINLDDAQKFVLLTPKSDDPKDAAQTVSKVLNILEDKFIEGKAVKDEKIVDVKKEELKDFPPDILTKSITLLIGDSDKKKD